MIVRRYLYVFAVLITLSACGQATTMPQSSASVHQAAISGAATVSSVPTTVRTACEHAVQAQFLDPKTLAFVDTPQAEETMIADARVRVVAPFDATEGSGVHHKRYTCTVRQDKDRSWAVEGVEFSNR